MTTQIQAFSAWLTWVDAHDRTPAEMEQAVKALEVIVAMAQNQPPDGGSDGSFFENGTPTAWIAARDITKAMRRRLDLEAEIHDAVYSWRYWFDDRIRLNQQAQPRSPLWEANPQPVGTFVDDDLPF